MADLGGIDSAKVIVIDTETTGLKPGTDEVLSLSIIDGDGAVLFDDYLRPARRKRWPKAAEINGITWNDVKDKQTLLDRSAEILPLFEQAALVVGYNLDFDLNMLKGNGLVIPERNKYDVMKWYAIRNGGRKVKLVECAAHFGYGFVPHSTLEDTKATLHCFRAMVEGTTALAGVDKPKDRGSFAWLVGMVISFILAAILGICLNTTVTTVGTMRSIFWTLLFLALGFFCLHKWRQK